MLFHGRVLFLAFAALAFLAAGCGAHSSSSRYRSDGPAVLASGPRLVPIALPEPALIEGGQRRLATRAKRSRLTPLIGLDPHRLRAFLGAPAFLRRDDPAEVWRYEAKGCVLDVFLYRKNKKSGLRVTHVEARGSGLFRVSPEKCLDRLTPGRRSTS